MLAANEAVATFLTEQHVGFLRRGHADPEPRKLREFAEFARSLGLAIDKPQSRFELQRVLAETAGKPEEYAVHYGLLRSLKQASLHPRARGPLRPGQRGLLPLHLADPPLSRPPGPPPAHRAARRARSPRADHDELVVLAEHCTRTERRAEAAERELIKVKLLTYLERHDRRGVPRGHHRRRGLRPLLPARRAAGRGPGPRHQPGRRLLLPRSRDPHPDRPPLGPPLPAGRPRRGPDRPRRRRPPRARPRPRGIAAFRGAPCSLASHGPATSAGCSVSTARSATGQRIGQSGRDKRDLSPGQIESNWQRKAQGQKDSPEAKVMTTVRDASRIRGNAPPVGPERLGGSGLESGGVNDP